jgi:hypothetical protein
MLSLEFGTQGNDFNVVYMGPNPYPPPEGVHPWESMWAEDLITAHRYGGIVYLHLADRDIRVPKLKISPKVRSSIKTSKAQDRYKNKSCFHQQIDGDCTFIPDGFELQQYFSVRADTAMFVSYMTGWSLEDMPKHKSTVERYQRELDEAYADPDSELWEWIELDQYTLLAKRNEIIALSGVINLESGEVITTQYRDRVIVDLMVEWQGRHNVSNVRPWISYKSTSGMTYSVKNRGGGIVDLKVSIPPQHASGWDQEQGVEYDVTVIFAYTLDQMIDRASCAFPGFEWRSVLPNDANSFSRMQGSFITPLGHRYLKPLALIAKRPLCRNCFIGYTDGAHPTYVSAQGVYEFSIQKVLEPLYVSDTQLTYNHAKAQAENVFRSLLKPNRAEVVGKWAIAYDAPDTGPAVNYLTKRTLQNTRYLTINSISYCRDIMALKELKSVFFDIRKHPLSPKTWTNVWFQYRYGIRLTTLDTIEILKSIADHLDSDEIPDWAFARSMCKRVVEYDGIVYEGVFHQKVYFDYRFRGTNSKYKKLYSVLRKIDLWPSLYNIWDLLPYTFVVDWFLPIGDFLEGVDELVDEVILPVDSVLYSSLLTEKEPHNVVLSNLAATYSERIYARWLSHHLPYVQPPIPLPGWGLDRWARYTDTVALIYQRRK